MHASILPLFGLIENDISVRPFGSGLINNTWKIKHHAQEYILQRINKTVFKEPEKIAHNIRALSNFLKQHSPEYLFVMPVKGIDNKDMVKDLHEDYYRLMPFIKNSHTIDVVQTPAQAREAAGQFGKFTRLLINFDVQNLETTIPDFHNLTLRYNQFEEALQHGNRARIKQSSHLINFLSGHKDIVDEFEKIKANPAFKLRVTHHDTKISNVLFDENDKGLCVIDLDTVMPGYFISDAGDMLRTYLSPVSEEEKDFSKIEIRNDFFIAIMNGYLDEMNNDLSAEERYHFVYAGKFMIYMQAVRFLTDYLNDDVYYGSKYETHNFIRASNQVVLLQRLIEKENMLQQMVNEYNHVVIQ